MTRYVLLALTSVAFMACAHKNKAQDATAEAAVEQAPPPELTSAVAHIKPGPKGRVTGTVEFTKTANGVLVKADLKGLNKKSVHGFHVHENGDCSSPDFKSAGGHYNPTSEQHGEPGVTPHHAGDFGNIKADKKGNVQFEKEFANLSLNGAVNPILGKALIVHAKADDLKTQPTGDSGDRIACGVVESAP